MTEENNRLQEELAIMEQKFELAAFYQTIRRIASGEINPEWSN